MSDDYLYDGTGEPDPEVVRLEQMLGRLRTTTVPQMITVRLKPDTTETTKPGATANPTTDVRSVRLQADRRLYVGVRFFGPALAAAATIALMVGRTWNNAPSAADATAATASWSVSVLIGTPRIGSKVLVGDGRIAVGQTLTTDQGSRAKMEVSDIGQVTVDERTRVRLVETRDGHYRLALERGTLHAAIAAPPGQFVVNTPSATATDLGCVYSLHVDEDGSGMLSVEVGWVAFEERGRESFVPAGASSRTDRVNGPGTPRYDDTGQEFREAIDDIDSGGDDARKAAALRYVLTHARGRDAMTLWHLIPRVGAADRIAVVDALASSVPPPADVSRDAVLRLDRAALDHWWDLLGLNEASWWRKWKQPLPGATTAPAQAAPAAQVKETVRLTVTGSGLAQPIEITDRGVLKPFSVYGGFLGGPASEPDAAWPRYSVTFDMQTREGVKTGAYMLDYVKSRWTSEGFIYLPGRGDARYRINIGTMMRGMQDGAWHHASDAWSAAINPHLP
jgi:hypothetical protein